MADTPTTEAGRALNAAWPGRHRRSILAIETEARAAGAREALKALRHVHSHTNNHAMTFDECPATVCAAIRATGEASDG